MAGPLALVGPALKALASGGAKKAAMGAVKGVATDKVKDFVSGKKRKGKGGALVKSGRGGEEQVEGGKGGAIVPTTPMVGSYKIETVPDKPDEVGKPSKISYESINNQLDSIIGLTNVLKKTSAAKIKNAENRRKAERKAVEKDKKRQKESLLEKGAGKVVGMAGNLYGKATEGFDPFKFFTMIFLGNLVKWFNENGSKIAAPLRAGLALMNNAAKVIRAGLKALGGAFKGGFKLIGKLPGAILRLGKSVGKTLLNVGKGLGKAFISIGRRLFKFIRGLLGKLRIPGLPRLPLRGPTPKGPTPKGPTPKGRTSPKGLPPGNKKVAPRAGNPRLQQPPPAAKPPRTGGPLNGFLKKLFGIKNPQEVESLRKAAPTLKKGSNFMKGARIPVVGPMIVFALNALDPDISLGEAAFKAVGTGLGEFLGFAIPIPVLGPIIGGLVGEVMGAAAYSLIVEKDPAKAGQKIMDAVTATGKLLGPILDWGKGVVAKFFDALPKIDLSYLGLGKVLDPTLLNPYSMLTEVPKALMSAFFGKDMKKEEAKKVESKSEPKTNINPNVSASSPEGYVSSLMPRSKASAFYKAMGINEQIWKTYKDTIASIETSGFSLADSYRAIGGSGDLYDGRYQMGKMARIDAAQALGIPTPSREELRNNAQLQEDMFLAYTYKNYTYMSGASSQFDSASNIQKLQYLGYAHNQGHAFATDWLKTGVISSEDGFGTKGTKFTDKLAKTLKPYLDGTKPEVKKSDSEGKPVIKPQTYTVSGITYDSSTGLPISGHEPTPAQVTSSQSQMSNGITGLSQQLSYEQTGNTVVMMQASNNQQLPMVSGNGGKGTPIIMGSGDVVNSYHKSQVLGSLYKS